MCSQGTSAFDEFTCTAGTAVNFVQEVVSVLMRGYMGRMFFEFLRYTRQALSVWIIAEKL